MSQDEILKVLRKHRRWLSTSEIKEKTKHTRSSTATCLRKLHKQKMVVRKESFNNNYSWKLSKMQAIKNYNNKMGRPWEKELQKEAA